MKFVLYDEEAKVYAGLDGVKITLEETEEAAVVFDQRDNPTIKIQFYNTLTGYNFSAKQIAQEDT